MRFFDFGQAHQTPPDMLQTPPDMQQTMVLWVCEASEVNNLTVLAVGPNGHNNKDKDKIASSRSDPPKGSDKYVKITYDQI